MKIRFVGNLFPSTFCEFYYNDVIHHDITCTLISPLFYPQVLFTTQQLKYNIYYLYKVGQKNHMVFIAVTRPIFILFGTYTLGKLHLEDIYLAHLTRFA